MSDPVPDVADLVLRFERALLALDRLLGALTEITRERQALERALDVFAMLFGPERSAFLSIVNGEPGWVATRPMRSVSPAALLERLVEAGGRHAVRSSGLLLPVRHGGELLGVVELEDVVAPEHLEDDVVLALAIAGVCGLAIANARKYEAIKTAEEALAVEHEHLLVTLRSIGDAVIATDTSGHVNHQVVIGTVGDSQPMVLRVSTVEHVSECGRGDDSNDDADVILWLDLHCDPAVAVGAGEPCPRSGLFPEGRSRTGSVIVAA